MKGRLDLICEQVGLRICPKKYKRRNTQTHARGTLKRLMATYGEGHVVLVLRCLRDSDGNWGEAYSENLWAISDCLALRPDWTERAGELLGAFDKIDLKSLRQRHAARRPWPMRAGLRGDIYNALEQEMG